MARKIQTPLICFSVLACQLIPGASMAFPREGIQSIRNAVQAPNDIKVVFIVIIVISSWIIRRRMQQRIKNDLGKTPDKAELISLETWMKVDEIEEKKNPGRAWVPRPIDLGIDDDGEKPIDLFPEEKKNSP
jgi:hypothetical protein